MLQIEVIDFDPLHRVVDFETNSSYDLRTENILLIKLSFNANSLFY